MMAGRRPAVAFFLALLATATALQPPKTMSVRCAGNEPREITRTPGQKQEHCRVDGSKRFDVRTGRARPSRPRRASRRARRRR